MPFKIVRNDITKVKVSIPGGFTLRRMSLLIQQIQIQYVAVVQTLLFMRLLARNSFLQLGNRLERLQGERLQLPEHIT